MNKPKIRIPANAWLLIEKGLNIYVYSDGSGAALVLKSPGLSNEFTYNVTFEYIMKHSVRYVLYHLQWTAQQKADELGITNPYDLITWNPEELLRPVESGYENIIHTRLPYPPSLMVPIW